MKKIKLEISNVVDARWLVNCAMAAIDESYEKGSVRHNEMKKMHEDLLIQIEKQERK
jgi:hypothetical protein